MKLKSRIKIFLIVGLSAAVVNLLSMVLFVEVFRFKTYFLKNLANILAIEISIIYHFIISRAWTWRDVPQRRGKNLLSQCISFHIANLTGMFIRIITFAILENAGVFYILNVIIGTILAAAISFILYDRFVFKRQTDEKHVLDPYS
jgi:putative flippase GtrA